jgi:hypothetical protein
VTVDLRIGESNRFDTLRGVDLKTKELGDVVCALNAALSVVLPKHLNGA